MPCKIGLAYLNVARQQKTDHRYSKGRTNVAAKAEEPRAIRAILRWQGSKGHDIQRHENQHKTHALKQTRPHHGMPVHFQGPACHVPYSRSEERRVRKEWVRTSRSRGSGR